MKRDKLGIVIVNYNGIKYNEACIDSIVNSIWDGEIQIYCVDNNSSDSSAEALTELYGKEEWFHLICMGKNVGFSAANNVGLKRAVMDGCNFLMIINNDTYVEQTMISELIQEAEAGECIVTPKIYYWDKKDTIWSAGGTLSKYVKKPASYGENEKDEGQYSKKRKCEYVNGCCLVFSKKVFDIMGEMDEDFFLYYEDTEYALRALTRGIHMIFCPDACMYHKVSASTGGSANPFCAYYISRNWPMCMKKYMKLAQFVIFLIYFLINRSVCFACWSIQGKRKMAYAGWCGVIDFFKGKKGAWRERRIFD